MRMAGIDEVSHKMTYALRLLRCVRSLMALSGHAETDRYLSAFSAKRTCREGRKRFGLTQMMLWTAPTLRHQGAIGWLRRNEPR
jgi:hypothetical protein